MVFFNFNLYFVICNILQNIVIYNTKMYESITDTIPDIDEPTKLYEYITSKLKPNIEKKTQYGEVLTPLSIVEEMLTNLDDAYKKEENISIFSNPTLKWFDPALGIGNFLIVLYYKLMDGLKFIIINNEERKKHILENMFYSSEILDSNILLYKKIFNFKKYKLNIHKGDTLKINLSETFGIKNFDVVLGNPPYNIDGIKHKGQKNIYVFFDLMALNTWIKPNGYLLFIHPPVYRIPNHKIQHTKINLNEIITQKKIETIIMYDISTMYRLMNVMINADVIIIKNTKNDLLSKTKIIDVNGDCYYNSIKPNDFIVNFGLNLMEKIKNKCTNGTVDLILNSEMHAQNIILDESNSPFYKNIHGITKKGIKVILSSKKHTYYNNPKLIINGIGSYNYVFHDIKGEYGLTQSPIAILNPDGNTIKLIQSPLFHYIADSTKVIGNNFNIKTSSFLPLIHSSFKIETDSDLYNFFEFNEDEIKMINKYSIPVYKVQELIKN
jgi:hypothetical protein